MDDIREDCISRTEAIKALEYDLSIEADGGLDKYRTVIKDLLNAIYNTQKKAIEALPSVQPKEIYNKGWKDGAKATAYHVELCEEENPTIPLSVIEDIKAKICEEQESAYADFERYKVEYLGQDWEDVLDSLPQDDFRYGMQRCIEIINKHIAKSEDKHISGKEKE